EEAGRPVGRLETAVALVQRLGAWLPRAGEAALMEAWQARLAFRGEPVQVETPDGPLHGELLGVTGDGALRLRLAGGETRSVPAGDLRLRPAGNWTTLSPSKREV
ncbi:MAG: hypothetical protein HY784_16620, partial [Chloroflexi bacterium]|nr:hypothetical protein [Chloroflexota bacterium]